MFKTFCPLRSPEGKYAGETPALQDKNARREAAVPHRKILEEKTENGDMFQAPSAARLRVPVRAAPQTQPKIALEDRICSPVGASENSPDLLRFLQPCKGDRE